MTDRSQPGAFSLAALIPCGPTSSVDISETLLSLAAQTSPALEIHVIVEGGSPSELRGLRDLVGTFDEDFSSRVQVATMGESGPVTALAFGVARSRATHVAVLYPDDVVFAHWSETFSVNAPRAGGRAMASLVALQAVDIWARGDERAVTTIERPRFPDPTGFDLLEHLLSPPLLLRGWALPRQAAHRFLAPGLPVVAEGWALRLAVTLTCGVLETGEVTYLGRSSRQRSGSSPVPTGWESERDTALGVLDRSGITLAPGLLRSMRDSSPHANVRRLEEELAVLRSQLQTAEGEVRDLAAAETAARRREAAMADRRPAGRLRHRCAPSAGRLGDCDGTPGPRRAARGEYAGGVRLPSVPVSREMAARRIPSAAPASLWSELLAEIDGLAPARRFEVEFTGASSPALRAARAQDLIRRGYSLPPTDGADRTVLVPRPAGVLHVVSAADRDDVPTWLSHLAPGPFRHHVVGADAAEEAFASLACACAGESWHLDSFLPRREWAEFMVEFIGSREIDLVQILLARPGVDLVPTLRASYPFIRTVVDIAGSAGRAEIWSTYVTARYGNAIDAFCAGQPDMAASLQRARVPASRIHMAEGGGGARDEAVAALHEDVYGRLISARVNERAP